MADNDTKQGTGTSNTDPPAPASGSSGNDGSSQGNDESDWERFSRLIDEKASGAIKRELPGAIAAGVKEALTGWQPSEPSGEGKTSQTSDQAGQQQGQQGQSQQQNRSDQVRKPAFLERLMKWAPETTNQ